MAEGGVARKVKGKERTKKTNHKEKGTRKGRR